MKQLLAFTLLGFALTAHAEEGFKNAVQIRSLNDTVNAQFMVNTSNPELGRAWIQITDGYQDPLTYDDKVDRADYADIKVPGLAFNSSTKEITYQKSNGEKIVCAKNVHRSFFTGLSSDPTGLCTLKISKERVMKDDGFYLHPAARVVVSLNP